MDCSFGGYYKPSEHFVHLATAYDNSRLRLLYLIFKQETSGFIIPFVLSIMQ